MSKLLFFLSMGLLLLLGGCNVLFEDDLTEKKVVILSPPNNYISNVQTQEFVWEAMVEADSYRVQIVADSFEYITRYVIDTIVNANRITLTLLPDNYEWRVIALNTATQSDYDDYTLTIVQDTSLSGQVVNAIFPAQNDLYYTDSVAFFWDVLLYAQNYQLQVATHPSFNSQLIRQDLVTPNDYAYIVDGLGTGTFYWRIRAMRDNIDTTAWTAAKQFSIDAAPKLQSPSNNSTQSLPLNLSWTSASNLVRDSLYIYYNSETQPFIRIGTTANSYFFNAVDTVGRGAGDYYWELRSLSNTGILSSYSGYRRFILN